jgi:hypothetical protein
MTLSHQRFSGAKRYDSVWRSPYGVNEAIPLALGEMRQLDIETGVEGKLQHGFPLPGT